MKWRVTDPAEFDADAPKFIPYSGWAALTGGTVEIRLNNCVVRQGAVDLAKPDSSALHTSAGPAGQKTTAKGPHCPLRTP